MGRGWVTAYAGAGWLLSRRGERVSRGQPIAFFDRLTALPVPHFEMRNANKIVDPLDYLPVNRLGYKMSQSDRRRRDAN